MTRADDASMKVVDVADVGEAQLLVHDAHAADPSHAFDLSRLAELSLARTPIGVFRSVDRPVYDDLMRAQLDQAREHPGPGRPRRPPRTAATPGPSTSPTRACARQVRQQSNGWTLLTGAS